MEVISPAFFSERPRSRHFQKSRTNKTSTRISTPMLNPVLTRRPSLSTKKVIPVCPPETWRKAAALVIAKTWRAATISGAPGTGFRKIFVPTVSKKVMTNIRKKGTRPKRASHFVVFFTQNSTSPLRRFNVIIFYSVTLQGDLEKPSTGHGSHAESLSRSALLNSSYMPPPVGALIPFAF